jgi:hypothetical protein
MQLKLFTNWELLAAALEPIQEQNRDLEMRIQNMHPIGE